MPFSKKNTAMQSMTWEEDYLNANAGSPVDGTWYEVTNYSGSGRLMAVGYDADTSYNTGEIKITADGNAHTIPKATLYAVLGMNGAASSGELILPFSLEFTATLVVEIRRDGDTNAINGWASYGILSEEWKREIIPAGDPVPDKDGNPRPSVYDQDVMVVWFAHEVIDGKPHGKSNKVEFLPSQKVDAVVDGTNIIGRIRVASFSTAIGTERVVWSDTTDSAYDGTYPVSFNGSDYEMEIINGAGSVVNEKDFHLNAREHEQRYSTAVQIELEIKKGTDPMVAVGFRKLGDAISANGYIDNSYDEYLAFLTYLKGLTRQDGVTPMLSDQDVDNLRLPKSQWNETKIIK